VLSPRFGGENPTDRWKDTNTIDLNYYRPYRIEQNVVGGLSTVSDDGRCVSPTGYFLRFFLRDDAGGSRKIEGRRMDDLELVDKAIDLDTI